MWGFPTLAAITLFGLYFSLRSGILRPRTFAGIFKSIFQSFRKSGNGVSPFAAAATALGGTVGVGSIVGVAYGISVGGSGSIFWMWVCSVFGMGLKYAEVNISVRNRKRVGENTFGGAQYRLAEKGRRTAAYLFCAFCIAASFFTGNLTQTGALSGFMLDYGVPVPLSALICVVLVGIASFGGIKRITKINSFIVPAASAAYILVCVALLFVFKKNIPFAFASIIREAFGFKAAVGGFSGAAISFSVREGFARSVFSNEAGMGSSPLAHATSDITDPETQGALGIFEVFFDTFIVSTLTAICLLSSGMPDCASMFGDLLGVFGKYLLGGLIAVFAFASVISWCCYAESCVVFIFGNSKKALFAYRAVFAAVSAFGAYISAEKFIYAADIFNALMMIPNMYMLFLCRNEITKKR